MTDSQESYQKYLQSDKWKTIRVRRLAMDNNECVLCGEPVKHVHHRRYPKVWGEETIDDLVCLCEGCHERHHSIQHIIDRAKEIIEIAYELDAGMGS